MDKNKKCPCQYSAPPNSSIERSTPEAESHLKKCTDTWKCDVAFSHAIDA